jgi:hypothetical protein
MTISLSPERVAKILRTIHAILAESYVTVQQLQSLIGVLSHNYTESYAKSNESFALV